MAGPAGHGALLAAGQAHDRAGCAPHRPHLKKNPARGQTTLPALLIATLIIYLCMGCSVCLIRAPPLGAALQADPDKVVAMTGDGTNNADTFDSNHNVCMASSVRLSRPSLLVQLCRRTRTRLSP